MWPAETEVMVSQLCLMCGSTLNCQTLCLGARPRYSLVVDEDVKKPTNQTNLDIEVRKYLNGCFAWIYSTWCKCWFVDTDCSLDIISVYSLFNSNPFSLPVFENNKYVRRLAIIFCNCYGVYVVPSYLCALLGIHLGFAISFHCREMRSLGLAYITVWHHALLFEMGWFLSTHVAAVCYRHMFSSFLDLPHVS